CPHRALTCARVYVCNLLHKVDLCKSNIEAFVRGHARQEQKRLAFALVKRPASETPQTQHSVFLGKSDSCGTDRRPREPKSQSNIIGDRRTTAEPTANVCVRDGEQVGRRPRHTHTAPRTRTLFLDDGRMSGEPK